MEQDIVRKQDSPYSFEIQELQESLYGKTKTTTEIVTGSIVNVN